MADDIQVKVGVKSTVGDGMKGVVEDIEKVGREISNKGTESGKGFAGAFAKGFRGDFAGAFEDIMAKLGADMKASKAKAVVWGAGITGALVEGIKTGMQLDEKFGISDKIANWWAGETPTGLDENTKRLREQREAKEASEAKAKEDYKAGLKKQNEQLDDEIDEAKQDQQNLQNQKEGFLKDKEGMGVKRDFFSRLMGGSDRNAEQQVDHLQRLSIDRDYRRQEEARDKYANRIRKRTERMEGEAQKLWGKEGEAGLARNPRLKRIYDAMMEREKLEKLNKDIAQRDAAIKESQLTTAQKSTEIAENTKEMKRLLLFNLQLK